MSPASVLVLRAVWILVGASLALTTSSVSPDHHKIISRRELGRRAILADNMCTSIDFWFGRYCSASSGDARDFADMCSINADAMRRVQASPEWRRAMFEFERPSNVPEHWAMIRHWTWHQPWSVGETVVTIGSLIYHRAGKCPEDTRCISLGFDRDNNVHVQCASSRSSHRATRLNRQGKHAAGQLEGPAFSRGRDGGGTDGRSRGQPTLDLALSLGGMYSRVASLGG